MNLFMNLKENKELSKNEKILADYILKHPEDVLKMSSKELGKACFVSTATVYRLCDKLNLAGFSDLKIKITSSLNDYLKSNGDFNFDFPVNPFQTHYEIVHKIKEDYEQTLNLTANLFSLDQLRLIASAMKKAKSIPAIKHGKLPLEMKEISYQEYLDGLQKGEYYARIARDSATMEGEDERNYNLY